ncbi:hypothetical protein FXO38_02431 [Capsicum annuum]|nr:hypothetical protein FXO38_02431 [Capsicum annuum]
MARVLPKFAPHMDCYTVNDIEDRIKAMLTKNQFKKFCTDSIFGVFMKKKNCVVQTQLGRYIMSLEIMESSTSDIIIRAKGTTLHFNLREFVEVTGLNCHSNRDDFGFDEDISNKIIDQYFNGSRFIQKKELFAAVTDKIWGNENDEDAFKFANLYFIHGFLLSSVDTVVIPRLYFDLVESDCYRDYPWGLVAYEELAKSLNKKLKPTGKFYMLHGMPLDIQIWLYECCSAVPHTVAFKVDSQISRLLNWKTNVIRPRYESLIKSLFNDSNDKGDSSNSLTKKKLKNQSKGVDQHTPKRTPPSRTVKISSVKTPIFKTIQSKEIVPSNRKDIPIQSPDMSFFNREDEDVLSKKVFEKFCNEVKDYEFVKPQLNETDKDTSLHESTPILHHDFDKNPEGTLNKKIIDESMGEAQFSDSQNTFSDEVLRSINLDFIQQNLRDRDDSKNTEAATKIIENTSMADCEKQNLDKQINSEVHTHEAVFGEGKSQQDLRDFQVTIPDELLPGLNEYVNLERSIIVHPSTNKEQTPVNVSRIKRPSKFKKSPFTTKFGSAEVVLALYSIDDPTLTAGGKEYHLNEYISGFRMHATIPWYTVDHIFIPINIKSKHHWVLAVLSFNSRCIYVYDSLSSAGHDSAVLAEVKKLAEVISYCLLACKFYEKKGIDIDNHPNYKLNDKHDFFYVYIIEDLPQQSRGSLDCGLHMITYAECLTFSESVPKVDFDPDLLHTVALWYKKIIREGTK